MSKPARIPTQKGPAIPTPQTPVLDKLSTDASMYHHSVNLSRADDVRDDEPAWVAEPLAGQSVVMRVRGNEFAERHLYAFARCLAFQQIATLGTDFDSMAGHKPRRRAVSGTFDLMRADRKGGRVYDIAYGMVYRIANDGRVSVDPIIIPSTGEILARIERLRTA